LNNKEQERENKLEKDNFKEGGLRQLLLIGREKLEGGGKKWRGRV